LISNIQSLNYTLAKVNGQVDLFSLSAYDWLFDLEIGETSNFANAKLSAYVIILPAWTCGAAVSAGDS